MPRLPLAAALLVTLACTGRPSRPPPPAPPAPAPADAAVEAAEPGPPVEHLLADAQALRAGGELEAARATLEEALARAPESDAVRLELAEVLVADGRDLDRAAALLAGVGERDGNARLHLAAGQLAELERDDVAAAAAYARALEAAKDPDPEVRLRRAVVLERLGRRTEALAELELARRSRPDDPVIRARLADGYEAAGLRREAEAELVAATKAAPERAAEWDRLAAFYRRAGRLEEARAAQARARAAAGAPPERELRPLPRSPR